MVRKLMQLWGMDIQTIYLYALIICGSLSLLYMLFGDLLHAIGGDISPGSVLNPTVVLSFFAILGASGYIFETTSSMASITILVISTLIALVLVSIIHFFILAPLSKAEQNTASRMEDSKGKVGEVIITIPEDGLGEVLLKSKFGNNGQPAKSSDNSEIPEGSQVKVVGIEDGVVLVVERIDT
ncbi:NfeD family protein [Bacillus cereus]